MTANVRAMAIAVTLGLVAEAAAARPAAGTTSLSGRVTDWRSGQPLEGVTLKRQGFDLVAVPTTSTAANGHYSRSRLRTWSNPVRFASFPSQR